MKLKSIKGKMRKRNNSTFFFFYRTTYKENTKEISKKAIKKIDVKKRVKHTNKIKRK